MATMAPGAVFGGYEIVRRLGSGGMGEVYLVRNPRLRRLEAMKVTRAGAPESIVRRGLSEASTMAGFEHPGIATVYDRGLDAGRAWYTMQYLPGEDLGDAAPLPVDDVLLVAQQVGEVLDFAHARSTLHRDVKPSNIHVRRDERNRITNVTMLDFGIAKSLDMTALTAAGSFVGTLGYSAPESVGGEHVDARTDQYAFACAVFELLTGELPFPARTVSAMVAAHTTAPPPRISDHDRRLHPADRVFGRALAKNPGARYHSCTAFATALTSALTTAPDAPPLVPQAGRRRTGDVTVRRRTGASAQVIARRRVAAGVAVLAVLAAAYALIPRPGTTPEESAPRAAARVDDRPAPSGPRARGSGATWGLVMDQSGRTYAFRDYPGKRAMLVAATDRWGYSPASWGDLSFESGCGAFATVGPTVIAARFHAGYGPDRAGAEQTAVDAAEQASGAIARVVDSLCVGDAID